MTINHRKGYIVNRMRSLSRAGAKFLTNQRPSVLDNIGTLWLLLSENEGFDAETDTSWFQSVVMNELPTFYDEAMSMIFPIPF